MEYVDVFEPVSMRDSFVDSRSAVEVCVAAVSRAIYDDSGSRHDVPLTMEYVDVRQLWVVPVD